AELAGDHATAKAYRDKAKSIKDNLQKKLWDPKREFFFHMAMRDEEKDGFTVKAGTLTYQTGRHAGSPHGREEIGFVPWQFGLPDPGYEAAWKFLMDPDYFFADYGPTTVGRRDPLFTISKTCCVWSGQSWPYATTQTLKAMANLLNDYEQEHVTRADYVKLLRIYARTHRKDGRPYIAEACHPDTGSWEGHDAYNHSEHYFHSGYVDLIVTGLAGLRPRDDGVIEVNPLAPAEWVWFALDDLPYQGHRVAIVWDRGGKRYGLGAGLHVLADGKKIASRETLGKLTAKLPAISPPPQPSPARGEGWGGGVNHAVNNEGFHFPRATASFTAPGTWLQKVQDGNYWYHISPPNRWTCAGSGNPRDWVAIDFGVPRRVDTVKLYPLDDGEGIVPPARIDLEYWDGAKWADVPGQKRSPAEPAGRRANVIRFPELETSRLRAVLTHREGASSGLTEFEAWGSGSLPYRPAPPPAGNLAANPEGKGFPKASASFTSRFDKVEMANDGRSFFTPSPHNRWTAYESPNASDWLEIDFGEPKEVGRVVLHLYDDRGGVQAPRRYVVQFWDGEQWRDVRNAKHEPAEPTGGQVNTATFDRVQTRKVRVMFTHRDKARSGLTEIEVWRE
ncbi:MAG TPA: discoidin domain-containing protein, partial [Gemmataceae bacterium]